MYFFYSYVYVYVCIFFSVDSLKFVIKEFSGQPTPPGGGGVQPDGIYNVPLYRVWCSSS